jgi:formate dehydrogenase maturation protein FdhE
MKKHSDYLIRKKDSIMENGSMTKELFKFYSEIFIAQEEFAANCGDLSGYKASFKKDIFPVLDNLSIVLEEGTKAYLSDLMVKLTDLISGVNPGMDFSEFKKNFAGDADNLLKGLLNQDYALLEKKGVDNRLALDEFIFVIHNIFKPFMAALKRSSDIKPGKEDWLESSCYFCGYLPDMSKIVESKENQRHLHCALCENEWEFPRLVCPACGCSEQTKHGFFEYEGNNIYRAYYCDECKHFIKSVRIPKLKEESAYDLAVEDVITNFLDAGMIEKGYKRI